MTKITRNKPQPPAAAPQLPQGLTRARHNHNRVRKPGDHGTCPDGPPAIVLDNLPDGALAA